MLQALRGMGANLTNPWLITHCAQGNVEATLGLIGGEEKLFQHGLRDAARAEQWRCLAKRRPTYEGIQLGVNRIATAALRGRTDGLMTHRLRTIMAGAVATCARLHRAKIFDSPLCRCCGLAIESLVHLTDDCSATRHIRLRDFAEGEWERLPPCLRHHGIVPALTEGLPARFLASADDLANLGATVQYALADMLEYRQTQMPLQMAPLPRWHREVRRRTA